MPIESRIAVGPDEVLTVLAHLRPLRKQPCVFLPEPVHSKMVVWKRFWNTLMCLQQILQSSSFHARVRVHHIFRYAGRQQPFLLGREGAAKASK